MTRRAVNPEYLKHCPEVKEAWANDLYQATVSYDEGRRDGHLMISLKRHDRAAVRDWRHLQQIKNEVAGPEREAVELFPAESRLMDTANQYWLWVAPAGVEWPIGYPDGAVSRDGDIAGFNALGKGRQRVWQPGLTTGRNELTPLVDDEDVVITTTLLTKN